MKNYLLSLLLVLIPHLIFGQQRSVKDIESMFKNISDVEAIMNGGAFQPSNFLKTILLSEDTPALTDIERQLLNDYEQVALMCNIKGKPFNCYFVKDGENRRGIVGLDGNVIVPPLSGNICNIPNGANFGILLVGELSRPTSVELLKDWAEINASRENDILGLFSAIIVDADKPAIHSLLPMNKYVFMSLGSQGNGKFDIFTLQVVGDEALWGIVNMKGKEILPNKYTGFSRKSHLLDTHNTGMWGKWVGTTEMDMSEALKYSNDLKAETQRRRAELASAINSFGESTMAAAQTIQDFQNSTADNSDISSDNESKGRKGSKKDTKGNKSQQSYNTDKATYAKYDSMLSQVLAGNRDASSQEIKEWRKKMKQLRTKWEAEGKSFPHSANEGE